MGSFNIYPVFYSFNQRKEFYIHTKNNSAENFYICFMKLNGEELREPKFSHSDQEKGSKLTLEMEK
ncbi:glycoside hydrolase domain-containing protein [uncultured Bacteroides sp.]|uniref:glycoside hydrolase domain-containing protein n=1 Tax=uncultured Bacteroides sp. TaxID=162156 RepID=UPI0034462CB7